MNINKIFSDFRLQAALLFVTGFLLGGLAGLDFIPSTDTTGNVWPVLTAVLGAILFVGSWMLFSSLVSRKTDESFKSTRSSAFWPFIAAALLPVFYLPFLFYRSGRNAVLSSNLILDPAWQTLLVLSLSLGLVVAFLLYRFPIGSQRLRKKITGHPGITITVMMMVWLVAANYMDISKNHYLNNCCANTPMFVDALRNAFSDQGPLYSQLFQAHGASLLGIHSSFIWYLFYPFFIIWPSYQWLLILSNIALALTAIPIYLLSKRFFGTGLSLIIVAIFLLNRTVIAQPGAADLSEERFLPLLLISSFYFWQTRRFYPFLFFGLLAITVREDVSIVFALIGLYSLIRKRKPKWYLAPIAIGSAWFMASMFWLIPAMNPAGLSTRPTAHYGQLGNSNIEIVKTLLFRPWRLLKILFSSMQHLATMYGLWLSFGFGITFLSASMLIAFPSLSETLLIDRPNLSHINAAAIAAALFPAFILGLFIFDRYILKKFRVSIAISLALVTLFSTSALAYTWFSPGRYTPRYNYGTAMEIMNQIPDDASVMLPIYMIIKAKPDQQVRGYYQVRYEVNQKGYLTIDEDYIVLDSRKIRKELQDIPENEGEKLVREKVQASPDYLMVLDRDDLQLYIRVGALDAVTS